MTDALDLKTLPPDEAWNLFATEIDNQEEEYNTARFGIKIPFDIYYYLQNQITIKPKRGIAIIRGRTYLLEDLYTEIEERNKVIKEWLVENLTGDDIITPRGAQE